MNHPEQNMQEMPPSPFNKQNWNGLIDFMALLQTIEYINVILSAHAKDGSCPASDEYAKAFPALVEKVQKKADIISAVCASAVPQLEKALEQYEYARLQAIANCSKEDCVDRDAAQKELGWDGERQILQ